MAMREFLFSSRCLSGGFFRRGFSQQKEARRKINIR